MWLTFLLYYPSKKNSRNSADILLCIFLQNFRSIFTRFSLFCHEKQCGNTTENGQQNFCSLFYLGTYFKIRHFFTDNGFSKIGWPTSCQRFYQRGESTKVTTIQITFKILYHHNIVNNSYFIKLKFIYNLNLSD